MLYPNMLYAQLGADCALDQMGRSARRAFVLAATSGETAGRAV